MKFSQQRWARTRIAGAVAALRVYFTVACSRLGRQRIAPTFKAIIQHERSYLPKGCACRAERRQRFTALSGQILSPALVRGRSSRQCRYDRSLVHAARIAQHKKEPAMRCDRDGGGHRISVKTPYGSCTASSDSFFRSGKLIARTDETNPMRMRTTRNESQTNHRCANCTDSASVRSHAADGRAIQLMNHGPEHGRCEHPDDEKRDDAEP